MRDQPTIRAMTLDDIEAASEILVGGGWGDRRRFFRFAIGHPGCTPLVAEVDRRIAGTGVATVNGPVGWVGMIFVDEALRGRGLGTALSDAVIAELETAGCTTLALLASPLGRPIYERLGFAAEMDYRVLVAPGGGPARAVPPVSRGGPISSGGRESTRPDTVHERIRPFAHDDLRSVLALDLTATGEDRGHLLLALVTPDTTRVAVGPGGRVVGFDVRVPWGTHPTIAPELVDGVRLLEDRRVRAAPGDEVRSALPEANRAGLTTLENLGWREERGLTRMVRGAPIRWDPHAIWGQFNYAIG